VVVVWPGVLAGGLDDDGAGLGAADVSVTLIAVGGVH